MAQAERAASSAEPRGWTPLRSSRTVVGLGVLLIFVLAAIIGPLLAPYDPSATSDALLQPPSASHLFGTTQTGQDVFSQVLAGARGALLVGFIAGAIATVLAVLVGVSSGFLGGLGDELLSLLTNVFLVIPGLPLIIVLAAYLPSKGGNLVVALVISITGWAWGARVLRAQTLSIRRRGYIDAARAVGERNWRIVMYEVVPNVLAVIAHTFLSAVTGAILAAAGLSFLGLGNVSSWSWGSILYWAQNGQALQLGAWWWYVPAGLCIALVGTSLALLNFGLDELINPRLRDAGITTRHNGRKVRSRVGFTPVIPSVTTPPAGVQETTA